MRKRSLPRARVRGKCWGAKPPRNKGLGLTPPGAGPNIPRLMSAQVPEVRPEGRLPEVLDAWRMVTARRGFEGSVPLASLPRLRDLLLDAEGVALFVLEFDRDSLQVPYVELQVAAQLPLQCQRTLQRFLHPVELRQRLGLFAADKGIDEEAAQAALPPEYEPLLLAEDGLLRPLDLIEDELILAVPVVAMMPGTEALQQDWPAPADEQARAHPFAGLAALKPAASKKAP